MLTSLRSVAPFLILVFTFTPQPPSQILQGAWSASVGNEFFHGKWSARTAARQPNLASGSWILLNDNGDIVLQGTWSARKSEGGWKGTWSARVLRARSYSGVWTASEPGPDSKTFAEMLQAAIKAGAAGSWRSKGYGGNWRLGPTP